MSQTRAATATATYTFADIEKVVGLVNELVPMMRTMGLGN